jgi:competence protein ComEA
MFENQIRGLIVVFLILAILPFIVFFSNLFLNHKIPILTKHHGNTLTIEIHNKDIGEGIYFTASGTSVNQLLYLAGIGERCEKDFLLENGMKLTIDSDKKEKISCSRIDNSRRLALGMPVDINLATKDDLLLIPGIGEITAQKILALRNKKIRFKNIEELMEIDGIKEKRLARLKQYLYL